MRRTAPILQRIDWITIGLVLTFMVLGLLNIASATSGAENVDWFALDSKVGKQFAWIFIALLVAAITLIIEGEFFIRTTVIHYAVNVLLLIAVLLVGKTVGGAKSWFGIGSISLQPSEFAKTGTVLMLAWLLSRSNGKIRNAKTLVQSGLIVCIPAALIMLQPDAGTVLVYGGLIFAFYREGLSGNVLIAVFCALLLLIPFFRAQQVPKGDWLMLASRGAIQYGLMYVCYIKAFAYLPSHQVALLTALTPLYVFLIHALRKRQWSTRYATASALAVGGLVLIKAQASDQEAWWIGFSLLQIAGIAFAYGQVCYRDWQQKHSYIDAHQVFGLYYAGAVIFTWIVTVFMGDWSQLPNNSAQWQALLYLGFVASGVGFYLWNQGATKVSAGTLAAFNNALPPVAMALSLTVFGESASLSIPELLRLILGGSCILAGILVGMPRKSQP